MNTKHDTITVLLAIGLEVVEAVLVLAVALVAVLLTVARRGKRPPGAAPLPSGGRPPEEEPPLAATDSLPATSPAGPPDQKARPLLHPLALVAEELETLPATALRPMAGTRSRRRSKRELVGLLVAMPC